MRRSLILDVVVRAEFHTLLLVAVYLLVAGHNQPGGGFAGGLVAGAALGLRFVSSGPDTVRRTLRMPPTVVLGIGLLVALTTAIVPLFTGHPLLDHGAITLSAPVLGDAKLTSAFAFDTGVFLVVVGLVAFLLESFGGPDDEPFDDRDEPDPAADRVSDTDRAGEDR